MASWADLDVGFEQRTPEGLMFFFFLEREEVAVEVAVKVELNGQRREEAKKKATIFPPLSSHLGGQIRLPLRQTGARDPFAVASQQGGAGEHAALAGLCRRGLGGSGRGGHERLLIE